MAYQPKYLLTFSDVYQNTPFQYEAFIYKKDWTGPIYEVSGSGNPLIIETDRSGDSQYRPFIASKATLNLQFKPGFLKVWDNIQENWNNYTGTWDGDLFDFTEFLTADADTFYLEVRKKQPGDVYSTIWKGWYIYTTDFYIEEIEPTNVSLQFSDSLLMKTNRFFNFPSSNPNPTVQYFPTDRISVLDVIMRCAYFSGITNDVSVEFPQPALNSYLISAGVTYSVPALLLHKNAFLVDIGKYDSIFNVLSGVCAQFGLMAYFKDNTLYIRSYKNLVNEITRNTTLYEITGFNVTTDTVNYSLVDYVVENDSLPELNSGAFKNLGRSQSIRFNYPIKEVVLENKAAKTLNTPNYNMSSLSQVKPNDGLYYAINNWYLYKGGEAYFNFNAVETKLINMRNVTLPIVTPFYPYSNFRLSNPSDQFATKFRPNAGFDEFEFIESEPFSVNPGDAFSFSYSAYTDGRLKNYPTTGTNSQANVRPRPVVSLVLDVENEDGELIKYFYDTASNKFILVTNYLTQGVLPLITLTNHVGDSDLIYYNIKGTLDIPQAAKMRVRHYTPYYIGGSVANPADDRCLYVQQCNLQVFTGSSISALPNSQTIKSFYSNVVNSDDDITSQSNIFIQDASRYVPDSPLASTESRAKNPIIFASCYSNHVQDAYYTPASGVNLSYANPNCIDVVYNLSFIQENQSALLQNTGLVNSVIEGTYKSDAIYFIGSKFTYDINGFDTRTFVLMDYSINLKQATYDSILYSSEFSSTTGKTLTTQTIIE